MGLISFLPDGVLGFQSKAWDEDGFSFSPLGETGEGFEWAPLCPSDISPKYDNEKLGCELSN